MNCLKYILDSFTYFFENFAGEFVAALFSILVALIVLFITKNIEKKRKDKREKAQYGKLLWSLSQELSLTIKHSNLIKSHIREVIRVAKLKGKVISKKNTLLFSVEHLKLYLEKLLENSYQHPLLTSVLSVFIQTLKTVNMALDIEELSALSSLFETKEDFEKSLDTYIQSLEEDYLKNLEKLDKNLQGLIEEELNYLKPDLKRLKDQDLTAKYLEIIQNTHDIENKSN